jgi:cytochrome c
MKHIPFNFTSALIVLGFLMAGAVAYDLFARGFQRFPADAQWPIPDGDPGRGREAFIAYGCGSCHQVPGIRTATGRVGPRLHDIRNQIYIAGILANEPENMVRWIQDPQGLNPDSAMPNLDVTLQDARDIAAYLYVAS